MTCGGSRPAFSKAISAICSKPQTPFNPGPAGTKLKPGSHNLCPQGWEDTAVTASSGK
jgi:hypothetical protein